MPGWPVKESCKRAVANKDDLVESVLSSVSVYYNYTGQISCVNFKDEGTPELGSDLWGYQSKLLEEILIRWCRYLLTK